MAERRWSAEFIGMLESLRMGTQFQQGRRYARAGHVRALTISSSLVTALVLDEDGTTERARVAVRAFGEADWARIERALAGQAIYVAKLLAGQLPDDIDRVFAAYGLTLFPDSLADIVMDCSCAAWQKPCRHLTAACYVLAESFDTDPFGILAWRGRDREELLEHLRSRRIADALPAPVPRPAAPQTVPGAGFWTAGPRLAPPPADVPGSVRRADALLDQLDPLPLHAGRFEVTDLLRAAYRRLQGGSPA